MRRREFLKSLGLGTGVTAFLGSSVARAAMLPAISRSGSLEDVEHIIVFMLENRSFDHYYGHLSGVRGYNDRFPLSLPDGKPIWFQGRMEDPAKPILPFHLNTQKTSAQFLQDLDHSWPSQHGAIAGGLMDAWPLNKTNMTMGYFLRKDIPFHYALADAFTICDHYFASIAGPTCPKRSELFIVSIDPSGEGRGPFVDDNTREDNPLGLKGFTSTDIEDWARSTLDTECQVLTDGLPGFNGIADAGRLHAVIVAGGRKPRDLPQFRWVNTVLGNLKTSPSGAYHAFRFRKYAQRYLSTMTYRFNRRFNLAALPMSLLRAAVNTAPRPERWLRVAESSC